MIAIAIKRMEFVNARVLKTEMENILQNWALVSNRSNLEIFVKKKYKYTTSIHKTIKCCKIILISINKSGVFNINIEHISNDSKCYIRLPRIRSCGNCRHFNLVENSTSFNIKSPHISLSIIKLE